MEESRLNFYRSTLHPLLATVLPFSFIALGDLLTRAIVLEQVLRPNPPGFYLVLLAIALGEAASANQLSRERISAFLPRLREFLLFLVGTLVLFMVLQGYLLQGDINPLKVDVLYPLALVGIQWIFSYTIHRGLKEREAFLALLVGHSRGQLKTAVRDYFEEATTSDERVRSIKRKTVTFQVLIFFLYLVLLITHEEIPAYLTVLVFLHSGAGILFVALLNSFVEEQAHLGDGFALSKELQRRRIGSIVLFAIVGLLFVLPLGGRNSLLPASYLSDFFSWLDELMRLEDRVIKVRPPDFSSSEALGQDNFDRARENLGGLASNEEPLTAKIARIVGLVVAILLGIGLLYFLLRPFLSKEFYDRAKAAHPWAFLKGRIRDFLIGVGQVFKKIGAAFRKGRQGVARLAETLRERVTEIQEGRAFAGRREEIDRSRLRALNQAVKAYIRLIRWGERGGVRFRKSLGPREYAEMLSQKLPDQRENLIEIGSIFEEIIFSGKEVTDDRTSRYYGSLRDVTRYRLGAV